MAKVALSKCKLGRCRVGSEILSRKAPRVQGGRLMESFVLRTSSTICKPDSDYFMGPYGNYSEVEIS